MLKTWIAFLFVSFALTCLVGGWVQIRALTTAVSFRAFRQRRILDLYWRELTPVQRLLLWPGFIAFWLTVLGAAIATLVNRAG